MRAHELAALRALLLERRAQLIAEGHVPIEPTQRDELTKPDEDEAPLTEMSQVIASNRNRARTASLQAIDEALRRMTEEPEEFGLCESCDEAIPERRLLLMPQATLCAACQAEQEAAGKQGQTRRHLTDYR